jgi:YHS domain-containing protein
MAVDPVCHKEIPADKAAGHLEHKAHKYYFCSKSCEKSFRANPEHYTQRHHKAGLRHSTKGRASCDFTAF